MAITYARFIQLYPGFESTDPTRQALIQEMLDDAEEAFLQVILSGALLPRALERAQMLWTAHNLTMEDRADNLGSGGTGPVTSQSLDTVLTSHASQPMDSGYGDSKTTPFGYRLARILRQQYALGATVA